MDIQGTLSFNCSICGMEHDISEGIPDFETILNSDKPAGTETQYSWKLDFTCNVPKCDNKILIEYNVWEYPSGSFNMEDIRIKGGNLLSKFEFDFAYDGEF